ncbi:hypothetical protein GCM10011581_18360 [Saccharopolyspora subtropica]|uniref:Uncharacterized protein n=1 Tax=Saccharopolyspora thermophila TaxID=89367 RepID=A0A917JQJ5_9PSEU|nr:hypothetical protein [Saccharopolyspora subtropica]GGI81305.1 hypothetical protein GCM10011581_18360 [Saccharopolyspora subtropica]
MTEFRSVFEWIRDEAQKWQKKADDAEPILRAVQSAYLSPTAFFVGDLMTLVPGSINADLEAEQYEEFRAYIERLLREAIIEFDQIGQALRKIADEYERTDSANSIDVNQAFHA